MVDPASLATVAIVGLASAFMAWAIGAGSSGSTPFAPAVGAHALTTLRAALIVGVLGLLGAVLQGAGITHAVGRELVDGATLSTTGVTVALVTAAGLVVLGVFTGVPIATAFTVTGAVVGAGLALGGTPAWGKYEQIAALWIATPFVAGTAAYGTARFLRHDPIPERVAVPALAFLVGSLVAHMPFHLLDPLHGGASLAVTIAEALPLPPFPGVVLVTLLAGALAAGLVAWWMRVDPNVGARRFLLALGALVAFSAGGSQVGLAIGPVLPLLDPAAAPPTWLLVGGGLGLLVGSWTGAPRMIKAIAQDYSALGERRGIAALIPAFALAQVAILYGIPVSFNEIVVSAVVGSGFAAGGSGVSSRKMVVTVGAWVGSLVVATLVAFGGVLLVGSLL